MIELEYLHNSNKRPSVIYEASIRKKITDTAESIKDNPALSNLVCGAKGTLPQPSNLVEAFERLHYLYAQAMFEYLQIQFVKKYGNSPDLKNINDELKPLDSFIDEAEKQSTREAFEPHPNIANKLIIEFLRYKYDYYNNNGIKAPNKKTVSINQASEEQTYFENPLLYGQLDKSSHLSQAVGKYVYYYNWLQDIKHNYL